jgi:hypothetical protein
LKGEGQQIADSHWRIAKSKDAFDFENATVFKFIKQILDWFLER